MDFIDLKTQYRALKSEIDARIQRVLDHGQYILGPEITELEEKLAARIGARHCISVASGTSMPTSTTVVATRTCAAPLRNARIAARFASAESAP